MRKEILLDLANETTRLYGDLPSDFAGKMAKRIERKYSAKVEPQRISELALHYRQVYGFAATIFKEYLNPPTGKYADLSDVDFDGFLERLVQEFPNDDRAILHKIGDRAVFYEYVR